MEQYSNLNVHGKIKQKNGLNGAGEQGTESNDVVLYPTLTTRVPATLPTPAAANEGKAIISNGSGYEFGEAGKVDAVQINSTAIAGDGTQTKVANILTGAGLTSDGATIKHSNSVNAGTIGSSDASSGATIAVPYATYDAQGHITVSGTHIHTINNLAASAIASGELASARLPDATSNAKGAVTLSQGTGDSSINVPTLAKVNELIASIPDPMIFKGTVGQSATVTWANLPQPSSTGSSKNIGWTYRVVTAYTNTGSSDYRPTASVGDTIISTGSAWDVVPSGDEPSGTVMSVAAGTGLKTNLTNSAPITSSGTISLADTSVTAGSYGEDGNTRTLAFSGSFKVPQYTVDAQGRLTASGTKTLTLPAQPAHQTIKQDGVTGATINRYAVCNTAGNVGAKTASITTGTFALEVGTRVTVNFINKNTYTTDGALTLNINNTGAKYIYYWGNPYSDSIGGMETALWGTCDFVYDGYNWNIIGSYRGTVHVSSADDNSCPILTAYEPLAGSYTSYESGARSSGRLTYGYANGLQINGAAITDPRINITNSALIISTDDTQDPDGYYQFGSQGAYNTAGFYGDLTGNVTGDVTGNVTGNASTATNVAYTGITNNPFSVEDVPNITES